MAANEFSLHEQCKEQGAGCILHASQQTWDGGFEAKFSCMVGNSSQSFASSPDEDKTVSIGNILFDKHSCLIHIMTYDLMMLSASKLDWIASTRFSIMESCTFCFLLMICYELSKRCRQNRSARSLAQAAFCMLLKRHGHVFLHDCKFSISSTAQIRTGPSAQ